VRWFARAVFETRKGKIAPLESFFLLLKGQTEEQIWKKSDGV
jgi:hypothetical protein